MGSGFPSILANKDATAFVDGTNVFVGTLFDVEFTSRILPWYEPSESCGLIDWPEKWKRLRSRFEEMVDRFAAIQCSLTQTRIPTIGKSKAKTLTLSPDLLFNGSGLQREPAELRRPDKRPLSGVFPIRGASGDPILNADGSPKAIRFGLKRNLDIRAAAKDLTHSDLPIPILTELAKDGTHLLYNLPGEIASSIWHNWTSGFSRKLNAGSTLWFDALLELSWQSQPGTPLYSERYFRIEDSSIHLIGSGLFPLLPDFMRSNQSAIPNDSGYTSAWSAQIADVVRASIAAIDEILGRHHNSKLQPSALKIRTALKDKNAKSMSDKSESQVFVSYSHKDRRFLDELLAHLKPLRRAGRVSDWSDLQIGAGAKGYDEIETALANSGVAVLLVTKDFLASDFIHDNELGPILKRGEEGGVNIVWVLVGDCSWQKTPLKDFQAAFATKKALAKMRKAERDSAWVAICDTIEKAVNGAIRTQVGPGKEEARKSGISKVHVQRSKYEQELIGQLHGFLEVWKTEMQMAAPRQIYEVYDRKRLGFVQLVAELSSTMVRGDRTALEDAKNSLKSFVRQQLEGDPKEMGMRRNPGGFDHESARHLVIDAIDRVTGTLDEIRGSN